MSDTLAREIQAVLEVRALRIDHTAECHEGMMHYECCECDFEIRVREDASRAIARAFEATLNKVALRAVDWDKRTAFVAALRGDS